jgi:hypothetical protein
MISNGTNVSKYSVNSNGTLSSPILTLSGLVAPLAISVSPDNSTVLVADGGSSQQVKAFSNSTGALLWTFGQAGGYANGPSVPGNASQWSNNAKFYFSDFDNIHTLLAYAPDGSFWVGDPGNNRLLHFAATSSSGPGSYIEQIMYMHRFYSAGADPNNPTRVFGDYLEFSVTYSPSGLSPTNGSWTLVNNWGYNVVGNTTTGQYDSQSSRLFSEATICYPQSSTNCHTYALQFDNNSDQYALVELVAGSGLRFTGYETPGKFQAYGIYPDGSLRWVTGAALGSSMVWNEIPLAGFDSSNNPIWDSNNTTTVASSPVITQLGPSHTGPSADPSPETSSNVVVSFDAGLPSCPGQPTCWNTYPETGYHLGGILAGTSTWLWRTATSTYTGYGGAYPPDGAYDIGNGAQYAGSRVFALGRSIVWGYHGEFWKGSETNEWDQVYDDGLMVGQFGVTGPESYALVPDSPPMMAGNAYAGAMVTGTDGNVYLYHNDEATHGGVHRWLLSGLNTIAEQNIPVALSTATGGLLGEYYNGTTLDNFDLATTRIDPTVNLSANPTGTNLTSTSNYSARWTGFISPAYSQTYTFTVNTNSGVNLWVDNNLLISQWGNTSAAQFTGTISLNAGTVYPIRLEYYNTATSNISLQWSSSSQALQVIPSTSLYPGNAPNTSNGVSLMDGLQFNTSLISGMYGWNMDPASDILTNQWSGEWWQVENGLMTENDLEPQDIYAAFNDTASTNTVTRDLGTNSALSKWQLSGTVTLDQGGNINSTTSSQATAGGGVGGSYLDVLDNAGKVIARFYVAGPWNNGNVIDYIYGNNDIIDDAPATVENIFLAQPISISAANGQVTFAYGPYHAVTSSVFDPTSNWQNPQTLRLYFFGPDSSVPQAGYNIDLQNMTFLATPSQAGINYGDVNGAVNGSGQPVVTIADAEMVAQAAIGLITLTPAQQTAAEVDGTGKVDIYDAFLIAEYAVGIISKFPEQS